VYNDEEEWFRSIFANSKKEEAIQNQYEFFVERMGGPALYSERKGWGTSYFIYFHYCILESPLSGLAKAESSIPCFCCDALAGDPALIGRHRPFPVTHQAAERWLHHMEKALESTPYIDAD
ncbi:hypothetical protein Golax_007161, partial [Gossypium laxum]|nr:hypothetical protein [Gossypium laxum]